MSAHDPLSARPSLWKFRRRVILAGPKFALYSVPDFGECRWTLSQDNLFGAMWRD